MRARASAASRMSSRPRAGRRRWFAQPRRVRRAAVSCRTGAVVGVEAGGPRRRRRCGPDVRSARARTVISSAPARSTRRPPHPGGRAGRAARPPRRRRRGSAAPGAAAVHGERLAGDGPAHQAAQQGGVSGRLRGPRRSPRSERRAPAAASPRPSAAAIRRPWPCRRAVAPRSPSRGRGGRRVAARGQFVGEALVQDAAAHEVEPWVGRDAARLARAPVDRSSSTITARPRPAARREVEPMIRHHGDEVRGGSWMGHRIRFDRRQGAEQEVAENKFLLCPHMWCIYDG